MDNTLQELEKVKNEFHKPYPSHDIDKMNDDFFQEFEKISNEDEGFETNFNTYCFNIAAATSYILRNKKSIPKEQVKQLRNSFFDSFEQYNFLENKSSFMKIFTENIRLLNWLEN